VDVSNTGGLEGAYDVVMSVAGVQTDVKQVTVGPGATERVSFDFTSGDAGSVTIDINGLSTNVVIREPRPAAFELVSLAVEPTSVVLGESCYISAIVRNTGEVGGSYDAELVVDGRVVEMKQVSCAGGAAETADFTFTPTSGGASEVAVGDLSQTIEVIGPAIFRTSSVSVSPEKVFAGEAATVRATVTNTGDVAGTQSVALAVNGRQSDSQTVTLGPGGSKSVSFTFTPDQGGTYRLSVGEASTSLAVVALETYTSLIYHYSVLYPSDHVVNDADPSTVMIKKSGTGGLALLLDRLSLERTPEEYFNGIKEGKKKQLPDWTVISEAEVVEDGIVIGYTFDYSNTVDGTVWLGKGVVLKKGGFGYYAVYTTPEVDWREHLAIATTCIDSFRAPPVKTGDYTSAAHGFSLSLPDGWCLIETSDADWPVVFFVSYEQPVIVGSMYLEPVPEGMLAEEYVSLLNSQLLEGGFALVREAEFAFSDGHKGHESVTSEDVDGTQWMLRLIVVIESDVAHRLTFSGTTANQNTMNAIVNNLARSLVPAE